MTGAVLSHNASRRPDGLATPGVLDQKRTTSSQSRDASTIVPLSLDGRGLG